MFLVLQMTATTTRREKDDTPTVAGTCDGDAAFVLCLAGCLAAADVSHCNQSAQSHPDGRHTF